MCIPCTTIHTLISFILHVTLSDDIFIKILNLEIAKEAWGKPKEEYQGSERTKNMKVMNFIRDLKHYK